MAESWAEWRKGCWLQPTLAAISFDRQPYNAMQDIGTTGMPAKIEQNSAEHFVAAMTRVVSPRSFKIMQTIGRLH